jgi:multidrug resistance efflux pump
MESVEPVKVAQQAPVKIQAPQPQPQVSKVAAKAAVEQVIRRKGQPKRGASGAYRSSK